MRLSEIAERIRPVTDMHTSASLNDLLQREITDRKNAIADYLLQHQQRFFNSIVVGVYGGSPAWIDIAVDPSAFAIDSLLEDDANRINKTLGLLALSGEELLFAIDGQHRVEGIREALKISDDIVNEEVGVLFVAHSRSPEGLMRTRRLFSTLNRYAKPVSPGEIVALDEDDAFAIVTRRLMNEHPLLSDDKAKASKQVPIPIGDKVSFTTMLTVYNICILLCDRLRNDWAKKKLTSERPSDQVLNAIFEVCLEFWSLMASTFSEVDRMRSEHASVSSLFRRDDGGHMLFRPVGQMAFARAIRLLMSKGLGMSDAFAALADFPFELAKEPWIGILWNPASGNMLATVGNQKMAARLLGYYAGYLTKNEVVGEYRSIRGDGNAQLPTIKGFLQ